MAQRSEQGEILKEKATLDVFLTVPMIPDMELAVSKTADALSEYTTLTLDQVDEIKQALIEACINSMEHSKSDDRRIYMHFIIFPERIQIQVADHGIGFDVSKVETPRIENKFGRNKRKRGWGLELINHYMDEVSIQSSESGTSITMIKRFSALGRKATNE